MGLVRGLVAPFRGIAFIARRGLWGYLVLPLVLNAGLAALSVWLGFRLVREKLGPEWLASSPAVAGIIVIVLAGLAGLLFFVVLQPVVGAPFVDLLSEKTERVLRGHVPSVGFVRSAALAVFHGLLKAVLYGFALAVVLLLGAISGVGGGLGVALYAIFLAFDGFDYPLSRRGVPF